MSISPLEEAKMLFREARYQEALDIIKSIEKKDTHNKIEQISTQLLKCRIIVVNDRVNDDTLNFAEELLKETSELDYQLLHLDANLLISLILDKLNKKNQMQEYITRAENLLNVQTGIISNTLQEYKAELFFLKGLAFQRTDSDISSKNFETSLQIYQDLDLKKEIAEVYYELGRTNLKKLDAAINYMEKASILLKELEVKDKYSKSLRYLGYLYGEQGEFDKSIEKYRKLEELFQETGDWYHVSDINHFLAISHRKKGDLNAAMEHVLKSQDYLNRADMPNDEYLVIKAVVLNEIGLIYYYQGEMENAKDYNNQSFALRHNFTSEHPECIPCFQNLGLFFYGVKEFNKAFESFLKVVGLLSDLGNTDGVSLALFRLVQIALTEKKYEIAREYLEKLNAIAREEKRSEIENYYELARALLLKSEKRMRKKMEAGKVLSELINKRTHLNHDLKILAIKHYCELLLDEYRTYGEQEVFQEVKDLVLEMERIGSSQRSFSIMVEALILQSKLALLSGDLQNTRECLGRALSLSKEKGMKLLADQVQKEITAYEAEFQKWKDIVDKDWELADKIDMSNCLDYVKFVQETYNLKSRYE